MHCKVREDVVVEEGALEAWSPSRKQRRERGGRKKVYGWVSGRERRRVGKEKKPLAYQQNRLGEALVCIEVHVVFVIPRLVAAHRIGINRCVWVRF